MTQYCPRVCFAFRLLFCLFSHDIFKEYRPELPFFSEARVHLSPLCERLVRWWWFGGIYIYMYTYISPMLLIKHLFLKFTNPSARFNNSHQSLSTPFPRCPHLLKRAQLGFYFPRPTTNTSSNHISFYSEAISDSVGHAWQCWRWGMLHAF